MSETFIEPTEASALSLFSREFIGPVVMLNMLKFKDVADYTAHPDLTPDEPISGREAYQKYIDHTLHLLKTSGGDINFLGERGKYFIGPQTERWDLFMLIRQNSVKDFIAFATDKDFLAGHGHRAAALEDSRLLPLREFQSQNIVSKVSTG
tara:strand:- start:352 stop:804 length:453 start_codon:yes stop_codon:yes gene_type:complete